MEKTYYRYFAWTAAGLVLVGATMALVDTFIKSTPDYRKITTQLDKLACSLETVAIAKLTAGTGYYLSNDPIAPEVKDLYLHDEHLLIPASPTQLPIAFLEGEVKVCKFISPGQGIIEIFHPLAHGTAVYQNLATMKVQRGMTVVRGQILGEVNDSAILDLSVREESEGKSKGQLINPYDFFKRIPAAQEQVSANEKKKSDRFAQDVRDKQDFANQTCTYAGVFQAKDAAANITQQKGDALILTVTNPSPDWTVNLDDVVFDSFRGRDDLGNAIEFRRYDTPLQKHGMGPGESISQIYVLSKPLVASAKVLSIPCKMMKGKELKVLVHR